MASIFDFPAAVFRRCRLFPGGAIRRRLCRGAEDRKTGLAWKALGCHYRQTVGCHRGRDDVYAGRKRRGRGLRDAGGNIDYVGHLGMGR